MNRPIPELRYRELEKLLELYELLKETPDGACNRLNLEQRTAILADVNKAVCDTFQSWGWFSDSRECKEALIVTMLEMGILPLKTYMRGIM